MYYTANSGVGEGLSAFPGIGLAFSDDGRTFEKHGNNPVLTASHVEGDPDCQGVAGGSVINVRLPDNSSEWRFYYTGCPTLGDDVFLNQQKAVCYATSPDGITWEKQGAVMCRDPARNYIDVAAAGPVVWQEENGTAEEAQQRTKQNRSEKKSRKAMQKLGMKPVDGIVRVTVKKSKNISSPVMSQQSRRSAKTDPEIIKIWSSRF